MRVDISQLVFVSRAMRASDAEILVWLRLFCHVSDTKTADIIIAAGGNEDCVEISQADGTVILEGLALHRVILRIEVSYQHILLVDVSLDSHFVSFSDLSILYGLVDSAPFVPIFSFLLVWATTTIVVILQITAVDIMLDVSVGDRSVQSSVVYISAWWRRSLCQSSIAGLAHKSAL